MRSLVRYLELLAVMAACLTVGALLGMAYGPNVGYCQWSCPFEQSTDQPSVEVCK